MAIIHQEDIGDHVECDWCGTDFTNSTETGGLLFQSKATCSHCMPRIEESAKMYGEQQFIRARCPEGMTFKAWVLGLRGGNNMLTITEMD